MQMRLIISLTISACLLSGAPALAQQTTGTIAGRVLDPQGAAAPGATVTASNSQTGLVRTVPTDSAGAYRLGALPVAIYELTVGSSDFSTLSYKDVTVSVQPPQTIEFGLGIAGIAQEVTVSRDLPLVHLTSSAEQPLVDSVRLE